MSFKYPSEFIDEIISIIKDKTSVPKFTNVPGKQLLKEFIDTCFYASLQKEEGEEIKFRATLDIDHSIEANITDDFPESNRFLSINLGKEKSDKNICKGIPFDLHNLRKIAGAFDYQDTIIKVEQYISGGKKELIISGVHELGDAWNYFLEEAPFGSEMLPSNITISSQSPGILIFSYSGISYCKFSNGALQELKFDFSESGFLREKIKTFSENYFTIPSIEWKNKDKIIDEDSYKLSEKYHSISFNLLFKFISSFGTGGIFILLKDKSQTNDLLIRYSAKSTELTKILQHCIYPKKNNRHNENNYKLYNLLRNHILFVSRLARIDGALVMTQELELLGFGAKIKTKPEQFKLYKGSDKDEKYETEIDSNKYGMRHKSSFLFANNNPEAIVFIFSEDGGINAVTKKDGKLILFENIPVRSILV